MELSARELDSCNKKPEERAGLEVQDYNSYIFRWDYLERTYSEIGGSGIKPRSVTFNSQVKDKPAR